jgi:signal peptidase I
MNPEFDFEKRYRLLREIIETVVLTLLMFLVIRFAVQNFNVDGTSMEPNLHNTELILVDKWSYLFRAPARGDVIVFVAPPHPDMDYVKRIIGLPGDVITIRNTTVIVDGVTLNETYVDPKNQGNLFAYKNITNLKVPDGDYFVLGDNRAVSSDSRDWGFVPRQNIIGRAAFVYWPLGQDNDGFLKNFSAVFANVHQASSTALSQPANLPGVVNADGLLLLLFPGISFFFLHKRKRQRQELS